MTGDGAVPDARPFAGKVVVLVHPAWHSCGSHQVHRSQAQAWRTLGAHVVSLALADMPGPADGAAARDYLDLTADLVADRRAYTAMPRRAILSKSFLAAAVGRLHGNPAISRLAVAERGPVPAEVAGLPAVDLVHCNHFFCLPLARKVAGPHGAPIVLETQDLQSRQYDLANETARLLPPRARYADMLAVELAEARRADLLIHLNAEEHVAFRALLPEARHALVYPAVAQAPPAGQGTTLLVVAAANRPNALGVAWLLREVLPLAPDLPYKIVGTVRDELRRLAPELHRAHADLFAGRVEDIGAAYRDAAAILMPTVAGHGISVKAIEAMSSGAPIVATPAAFRGMDLDLAALPGVVVAQDAAGFAAAIRAIAAGKARGGGAVAVWERLFSPRAYAANLAAAVAPLFAGP